MLKAEGCPICGGAPRRAWPALVAPFIAEYVLEAPVAPCRLLECGGCGHRCFDLRYTDAELSRLYRDYRGAAYFACRHRHEPWYTAAFNQAFGDPGSVTARRAELRDFFTASGCPGPFGTLLDFGGDSGQLVPPGMAERAFVHDLSGVPSLPGVEAVHREEDLLPGGYDVVLLSHVLEHVPEPMPLLARLHGLLRPGSGLLYVEVPLERPRLGLLGKGRGSAAWLDFLRVHPRLLRAADFCSTALRVKAGILPPLGFMKLHEHVNFFSESSLTRALGGAGLRVLRIVARTAALGPGRGPVLSALARPDQAAGSRRQ